jgi:hypothetical protein
MERIPKSLFCPLCGVKDAGHECVPSLMIATQILLAPLDGHEREKPPYFSYRCARCGYGEIHKRTVGVA